MANNEYLNKNFLDSYGTKWLFDILTPNSGSLIYTAITDESVDIQNKIKTTPAWNNGEVILSSVHTASQIEPNYKDYSLNVYSYDSCSVETKQFTIEYGHKNGYGTTYDYITQKTETKAIYKKYQHLIDDSSSFSYNHLFAIKFNDVLETQDGLHSDFFSLRLTNPQTSSNYSTIINYDYFISQSSYDYLTHNAITLVSGSLEDGIFYENGNPIIFGKLYENQSIVILDADALNTYVNLQVQQTPDSNQRNTERLYFSISSSINNMNLDLYSYWALVNLKRTRTILNIPILIPAESFNYSTNPSFYNDIGKIKTAEFVNSPTTYFTTLGLYNSKYELLAVAKFSRPFKKTFTEQYVFDINLEIK
jgi:hypothetical protein